VGDISALFLDKKASVIAFEPDPVAFGMLQKRFVGNPKMEIINKAVSHQAGIAKLFFHNDQSQHQNSAFTVSSSIVEDKLNINTENAVEVETVDLDGFISTMDRKVDILKMDVEGAEIDILHRLIENETYRKVGLILVETHETKIPGHQQKVADLKNLLQEKNIQNIKLNWI